MYLPAHPIQRICRSLSVPSPPGTPSRDTYTVKVHARTTHSRFEFPGTNSSSDDLAQNNIITDGPPSVSTQRLFDDPSVLSLLDLYDSEGRPNSDAFQSTPPHACASSRVSVKESPDPSQLLEPSVHALRSRRSSLRLLLMGDQLSSLAKGTDPDESCDLVDWMERQLK